MEEKIFNVTIRKESTNRHDGQTGLFTMIRVEQLLPGGKTAHLRSSCSYEVLKRKSAADFSVRRALKAPAGREAS